MAGAQFVKKKPDVVSALRPAFFIQYLESCISRLNVIPCHDFTLSVGEPDNAAAKLRSEQTVTPLHEQSPATYFLRLNNLETFVENEVVQFRSLRHGHVQSILDPSAVNGDHSPIPEQQLHAAGVHVEFAGSFIVCPFCLTALLQWSVVLSYDKV